LHQISIVFPPNGYNRIFETDIFAFHNSNLIRTNGIVAKIERLIETITKIPIR
jgi:hypothetical protein